MLRYMATRFAWFLYGAIFGGLLVFLACVYGG